MRNAARPPAAPLSAEAFLAWTKERDEERFELHGGAVVAMAPERAAHARAKLAIAMALRNAIDPERCEVFGDGMAVRVDERTVYEPDASVRCGDRLGDDAVLFDDPVIVVEVVSPGSRGIDSGDKLQRYLALPGLAHYLVMTVAPDRRAIIHHRRLGPGEIATTLHHDGLLRLDPPGLIIDVGAVFAAL